MTDPVPGPQAVRKDCLAAAHSTATTTVWSVWQDSVA